MSDGYHVDINNKVNLTKFRTQPTLLGYQETTEDTISFANDSIKLLIKQSRYSNCDDDTILLVKVAYCRRRWTRGFFLLDNPTQNNYKK